VGPSTVLDAVVKREIPSPFLQSFTVTVDTAANPVHDPGAGQPLRTKKRPSEGADNMDRVPVNRLKAGIMRMVHENTRSETYCST
jgi:hypothetical protein